MCQAITLLAAMTLCDQEATVTYYSPEQGWGCGCITASGLPVRRGYAAHTWLPFGTRFILWGDEYEVQDRGGGLRGNHFDIFFETVAEGRAWFRSHVDEPHIVQIIGPPAEVLVEEDYVTAQAQEE